MVNMYNCIYRHIAKSDFQSAIRLYKNAMSPLVKFHAEFYSKNSEYDLDVSKMLKYEKFQDKDSPTIFDIEEERKRNENENQEFKKLHEFSDIILKRGVTGVFDIGELVDIIKQNKGQDVCVIAVPKELKYIDYMCSVTCRNAKHMLGIAEFIRKIYKRKRSQEDPIPKIEGANSQEWIAIDLGNIALHLFLSKVRQKYDIDMLWSIGPEYDTETNKPEESLTELLENYSVCLENILPKA